MSSATASRPTRERRAGASGRAAPRAQFRPADEPRVGAVAGRVRTRPATAVASRTRRRSRGAAIPGTVVVLLVGLLLGGIVSLQVAALRANMAAGDVRAETRRVQAQIGNLEAAIAAETTPETIAAAARRIGMVYAPADAVRTVRVRRGAAR